LAFAKSSYLNNCIIKLTPKKNGRTRKVPIVTIDYTKNMNCVDHGNALVNTHFYKHRPKKWTFVALHVLIKTATVNWWILFNNITKQHREQRTYLTTLCGLLSPNNSISLQKSISTLHIPVKKHKRSENRLQSLFK
jgi:hypothetical protein